MKVIRDIKQIKRFRKPVVALGVFDGVHCAHRLILKEAVRRARMINGTSVALTFWPHPQKEESLYSLEHRLRLIAELGIDACIVIKFTKRFAGMSARSFIRDILAKRIGASYVYVGKNFRFGRGAQGDFRFLKMMAPAYNFKLRIFDLIKINHTPVSSTYIRRLITRGRLEAARRFLCKPVSLLGTVIKGASLGKKLGFPTANIDPHHEIIPPNGIYAARVLFNRRILYGVCYIGTRPTFNGGGKRNIEVFILDFDNNIYGKYLEVQFIGKIRNDRKFNSCAALAAQIKKDVSAAKKFFPSTNYYTTRAIQSIKNH